MNLPSGVWRHYKGGLYQVLGVGQHTETGELVVVYIPLTGAHLPGPRIRVRPLNGPEGFMMPVDKAGHIKRFTEIGDQIPSEYRTAPDA